MLARRGPTVSQPRGLRLNRSALRRRLALRGLSPAESAPSPSAGTWESCAFERVRLLEGNGVVAIPVGPPEPWPEPVAFLDGFQQAELLAYAGTHPVCGADVAAAVRVREAGSLRTVVELRRTLLIGRGGVLEALRDGATGSELVSLPDDPTVPPLRDLALAAQAVGAARAGLEAQVWKAFRAAQAATWLVIDGTLAAHAAWLEDQRAIGVCRSHLRLPFEGANLTAYLQLPAGHRSPVFAPPPVDDIPWCAWALRLRPWEGHDLVYGLIRVEVAAANGAAPQAGWLSRHLLAERAPLPGDGMGSDRMLYPLQGVRDYLTARLG